MNSTPNGFSLTCLRLLRGTVCMAMLCGVAGMANGSPGDTELISVTATSSEAAGLSNLEGNRVISADGRFVVFGSEASTLVPDDSGLTGDVFVRDRQTGQTQRVSVAPSGEEGNDWSGQPCISANGRFVAFTSRASNLVAGDHNNDWDVSRRICGSCQVMMRCGSTQ